MTEKGRVTLPGESGQEATVLALCAKWGADAIRDSDGTALSPELLKTGLQVCSTVCLIREDLEWAKAHPESYQQKYLMSDPVAAVANTLEIEPMAGFFREQFAVDTRHDPQEWWEVRDRTDGTVVPGDKWQFDPGSGRVSITGTAPGHVYTVSFLVYQIWEMVSMYNHVVNGWTTEHRPPLDPWQPEARRHMLDWLDDWLAAHPKTDVVRLTSMVYMFPGIRDADFNMKYCDWAGYTDCVNPRSIRAFEKEKGYRVTAETFVDQGYYNHDSRVPSKEYLDWIEFQHRFVTEFGREAVDRIHKAGKKAIMFFCDHWIGTEPYGPYFKNMGLDGLVNPVMAGGEARRVADVPGDLVREIRLYPYFFPENLKGEGTFRVGGDPVGESRGYWMKIRRSLLRKCVDRIGYGGYLSLTNPFPEFQDHVADICNEFRTIVEKSGKTQPYSPPFKVAILNAWGRMRSWIMAEFGSGGLQESISGMPVQVEFINFDDIRNNAIPEGVGVIVNTGNKGTSWSGGEHWGDPAVVANLRSWVRNGGGFVGIGEPTAFDREGACFQLRDVLGVEQETGLTTSHGKPEAALAPGHFITADLRGAPDLGQTAQRVYAYSPDTGILAGERHNVVLSCHDYGAGRAVYFADYGNTPANVRTLLRAFHWAAHAEDSLKTWYAEDIDVECAAYPETGWFVVINNGSKPSATTVWKEPGASMQVTLEPYESKWFRI